MNDIHAITSLLYRYCDLMDSGDFEGASQLLSKAQVRLPAVRNMPGSAMRDIWRNLIILYPCGTPRTQHLVTNPVIDIDASGTQATCRSRYMVLQQTDSLPLQVIAAGRYEDEFARDEEGWHFTFRDYSYLTLSGNLNHHLRNSPAGAAAKQQ